MRLCCTAFWLLLLLPSLASAQTVEVAAGGGIAVPSGTFSYRTQYVPPAPQNMQLTGNAEQTLTLARDGRASFWGAVAWFPWERAGIEGRLRYRSSSIDGTSSPRAYDIAYVARQPPDFVLRQYTNSRRDAQPPPEGTITELAFDLTAVGRFGDPGGVQFRAMGGATFASAAAEFGPVDLTTFSLGGHSVLFADTYALTLDAERAWASGVVGGLELQQALSGRTALVGGVRASYPGVVTSRVRVTSVETLINPLTVAEAQAALGPFPLQVRPWTFEVVVGIRFR